MKSASLIEGHWHQCGAPACRRRIVGHYFCCGQHRSLLGWQLSADLQTAWRERAWRPEEFNRIRRQAFKAWGWQPEEATECPANSPQT